MVPNPIGLALPHAEWRNGTACTHIGDFGSAKSTGDDVSKMTEFGCQTGPSTVVLASKPTSACLLRLAMGVAILPTRPERWWRLSSTPGDCNDHIGPFWSLAGGGGAGGGAGGSSDEAEGSELTEKKLLLS
jgi:hypothetical protein